MSAAPAMSRATSLSLGARCIFAGLVGEDEAGAKLKADLAREKLIEAVLVLRFLPPDDAQGALRLRAFFHPHAARGLGAWPFRPRQMSSKG